MTTKDGTQAGQIDLAGVTRTYRLACPPAPEAPLALVLHGTGSTGKHMAGITGLAQRGPAAGFATVFPDGLGKVWDGGRQIPGREDIDDSRFLAALVDRLAGDGVARAGALFLVGMSNGAFFAEHLARHCLLGAIGIVLVAGTATEDSRRGWEHPARQVALVAFEGTADPVVPYRGGPIGANGAFGRVLTRLATKRGETGHSRLAVPAETVAQDWAATNCAGGPEFEHLKAGPGELPVTRLTWSAPESPAVVLYRVEGGGHTWPGGPQYLAPELIGPVAHQLDATGILLQAARRELSRRERLRGGPGRPMPLTS